MILAAFATATLVLAFAPRFGSAAGLRNPNAFLLSLTFKVQGPKTCNGSNCHGGAANDDDSYKAGTEGSIWADADRHAKAYITLGNAKSKAMAAKLSLKTAANKSERCLVCHSLDVPADKQGDSYDVKAGVSCNSCHGPSSTWNSIHQSKGWLDGQRKAMDHGALLAKYGIYDTAPITARADRCTSCHLGIEADLVKAGHPQPVFDLAYYSEKEPKHWKDPAGLWNASLWAGGQAVCLRDAAAQVSARATAGAAPALVKDAYQQAMSHYTMLRAAVTGMGGPVATLDGPVKDLNAAVTAGAAPGIAKAADAVAAVAEKIAPTAAGPFTAGQTKACLTAIAGMTAADDYAKQQQAMAIYDLSVANGTPAKPIAALPSEPGKPIGVDYAARLAAAKAAMK